LSAELFKPIGPRSREIDRLQRRFTSSFVLALLSLTLFLLGFDVPRFIAGPAISSLSLKGGPWLGYKLGYVGTVLMIVSQTYSLIKARTFRRTGLGSRRAWLRIHCFLDLLGPSLILIHAGFPYDFRYADPFRYASMVGQGFVGLVAVAGLAAWLVLTCVASGFFGRYLYREVGVRTRIWFRAWRPMHLFLSGLLYLTGMIHLALVVWFKFISG